MNPEIYEKNRKLLKEQEVEILKAYNVCYVGWVLFDKSVLGFKYEVPYLGSGRYHAAHISDYLRVYISYSEMTVQERLKDRIAGFEKSTTGWGWSNENVSNKIDYLAITAEIVGR
jgi:hypothetical protein